MTLATKAMAHIAYTGCVLSCIPCACPHPTRTLKHSNMLQRPQHTRHTATTQGMYQGAGLVHARAQLASYNQQQNTTFIGSQACSRGDDTGDTLQLHKTCTKAHASSMPVHNRCNEIKNRSFISIHACSRGDATGDTLQLHKACTKVRASSMPMHNRCKEIKNIIEHLSALTHAAKATAHETHCCYTRHVPRRGPCPCPCIAGVLK